MSSKNKTRKNRKTTPKNTTRKSWNTKVARHIPFKINNEYVLDKNNDKRVRYEKLKPGVTEFLPENKAGDIRRRFSKKKDNWKPEDVIKFDYLLKRYGDLSN